MKETGSASVEITLLDIMLVPLVNASVGQHAFLLLLQWFDAVKG